ncbi:MAG: hypothetical protein ABI091_24700, partial [Ferruginibacter sp.]
VSTQFSYGQKTEINFNAYSGLFSFRGDGAASNSSIISYPFINPPTTHTLDPYGKKNEFSYSLEFQGQRLTKRKNIYGLGISFESLTSRVNIYKVGVSGLPPFLEDSAIGKTKLKTTFVTLNPFIGHRFLYHKMGIDLLAGSDISFCLNSKEKGNATSNNKVNFTVENNKSKPSIDFRPRIQLKTQINKFGFLVGYSLGLTNYQTESNPKTYTSFLRLGLSYQLK